VTQPTAKRQATRAEPEAAADPAQTGPLDWTELWYPVAFVQDLPLDRPSAVSIHDRPLVLHRDENGSWACALDRCPHRLARLSDGRLHAGKLECLYHGWQFSAAGRCVHIPQLPAGQQAPSKAELQTYLVVERQGLLWVWLGDRGRADPETIATIEELDDPEVSSTDFMMDLPYEQSYLVENVLDVAHIHVAHDGMRGGGLRRHAKPLEFAFDSYSRDGIDASFRTLGMDASEGPALERARVGLRGPHLVWYRSDYVDRSLRSGLALYALPLGAARCRLIYRAYSNFGAKRILEPRWFRHGTLCTILEQDMNVVVGQSAWIDSSETPLKDAWLPIKSSDPLVVKYRQWLDEYGRDLPNHRGFSSTGVPVRSLAQVAKTRSAVNDKQRYLQHTQLCSSCSRMHRVAVRTHWVGSAATLLLLVGTAWWGQSTAGGLLGVAALLAGALVLTANRIRLRLERPSLGA